MASLSRTSLACGSRATSFCGRGNATEESRSRFAFQKSFVSTPIFSDSKLVLHNLPQKQRSRVGLPRAATEVVEDRVVERKGKEKDRVLRVGLICGGPSAERGISLNSARSVLDHIEVFPCHFSRVYGSEDPAKFSSKVCRIDLASRMTF